ncbi:hypothetical protein Sp245p_03430 [Azospirillum baldaniorum]|uniref:Uncharacterized protein n=1 Tax=Azospirillum baldaniorum TaxID=1064539 RepID=A0A9P1JTB1_9PROT|nr:hypothetical protein [Azospirillum baldaniorum]AWJ88906.1 hypothetical protein Sp245p_03430 [Azospirillum baldaniorum]TWA73385.1 hypothetical protein FBZ85_11677 [Azospirillum brasilense]CCC99385.1 protein of unknown function [Azospirillum baldaniorum]
MARPCPPNGLARAAWFRETAAEVEETDPKQAIYCRGIADQIERREFGALPLLRLMDNQHPSQS